MAKTYDVKCFELAEHFMFDMSVSRSKVPEMTRELAQRIQNTIEDFMEEHDPERFAITVLPPR